MIGISCCRNRNTETQGRLKERKAPRRAVLRDEPTPEASWGRQEARSLVCEDRACLLGRWFSNPCFGPTQEPLRA